MAVDVPGTIPYPSKDDRQSKQILLPLLLKHVVEMLLSVLQTYAAITLILFSVTEMLSVCYTQ
jgi:hypothetical protein